jgi:hypothetical protein
MNPVYIDLHIHTSTDPTSLNESYDLKLLLDKINQMTDNSDYLISLTDHNTINETVYLKAAELNINIIVGVELHIKNYDTSPAYHCHIYFKFDSINSDVLKDLNKKLDKLYPKKVIEKNDSSIPKIQDIQDTFDAFEFLLLPHGGQSHCTFDTSIPENVKFDTTMEKSVYYNLFDGFTARGNTGLERTQEYFKKLGINDFVNLVTCTDNYNPNVYPNSKAKDPNPFIPTWMFAEPTFEGLRLSLSESSRLHYVTNKPKVWSEFIKGVKLFNDKIDIDVILTPGLNVVIGGSSSGKTLFVDSLCRKINNSREASIYESFAVDKLSIDHPSNIIPHYLSQNYIMNIVSKSSEIKIDQIEIIKNVFPGDTEIREKIDSSLRKLKQQLKELIQCVKEIDKEDKVLNKIPILSRLITRKNIEENVFEKLQPTSKERNAIEYKEQKYIEHDETLDEMENVLESNPFIKHDKTLIPKLKKELQTVFQSSSFSNIIRAIIVAEKGRLDRDLKAKDTEDQTKKQNLDKLLESIRISIKSSRKFKNILHEISRYAVKFDSEKILSMGHTLYIENGFQLNKDIFLEVINKYLRPDKKTSVFKNIIPENLFDANFAKKNPKVEGYDDFEKRIYKDFEDLNNKVYKIVTNEGKSFDDLSAGWKTSVILDLILGYEDDIAPVIIDQPEDNLATNYINNGLVKAIKKIKSKKQVILVSHNATIPMLADAQNIVLCTNEKNKIKIRSSAMEGKIFDKSVLDHIAEITDGGKPSIKKRVKKYNLKKFTE